MTVRNLPLRNVPHGCDHDGAIRPPTPHVQVQPQLLLQLQIQLVMQTHNQSVYQLAPIIQCPSDYTLHIRH